VASPFLLLLSSRSWTCDWNSFQPVRNLIRCPALDVQRQNGCQRGSKVNLAPRAVNKNTNTYQFRAVGIDKLDALIDAAACCQNVIHDEHALAGFHVLRAAQETLSIGTLFTIGCGGSEMPCDFVGKHDAKCGWPKDDIGFYIRALRCKRTSKLLNILRIAENVELFKVSIRVASTGQYEVTGQQCAGFFKQGEGFSFSHSTLIVPMSAITRRYT